MPHVQFVENNSMFRLIAGCLCASVLLTPADVRAQLGGQQQFGGGLGGFGGGQGGGQGGGFGGQFPGGIAINAEGLIAAPQARRINPRLEQKRLKEVAGNFLSTDLTVASELRKVSLNRLEDACRKAIEAGNPIPVECQYFAGITQIHYLFASPETGDLIIAGPAEGFAPLQDGRVVGVETGRPVLTLDDLLAMLRIKNLRQTLGCSFDPEPDRLARCQAWNKANNAPASAAVARQRFFQIAKILGNWNVSVFGLPDSSHAAVTTVEADYQLKRVALGIDRPRIRGFRSHLDMAGRNEQTFCRWWLAPRYEVIERSEDGNAFHLAGPRLQLMSQNELVDAQGNRSDAAFKQVSVEKYTQLFNKHIEELCKQLSSFAAIQNLFDLAVISALIQSEQLTNRVGWQPDLFMDEEKLKLSKFYVPTEVGSLVNVKPLGRSLLVGLIGGGVTIVPNQIISRSTVLTSEKTPDVAPSTDVKTWWWD